MFRWLESGGGGTLREACGVMCFLGGLGSLVRGEAVGDVGRGLLRWRVLWGLFHFAVVSQEVVGIRS